MSRAAPAGSAGWSWRACVRAGSRCASFTRDPDRAAHFGDDGIEIVTGDVRDRASVERAMSGVTTVVSAVQGFAGPGRVTPASVDRDGNANLIEAAAGVGADVILMSVVGASPTSPMELFRAKYDAEERLRASGAPVHDRARHGLRGALGRDHGEAHRVRPG